MLDNSTVQWTIDYPKEADLEWKKQVDNGYEIVKELPKINLGIVNVNRKNVDSYKVEEHEFFG